MSNKIQPIQGPYFVDKEGLHIVSEATGQMICTMTYANKESIPTAQLLASAPELLEALKKIQVAAELAIHGGSNNLYQFCEMVMLNTRPAIKKATE